MHLSHLSDESSLNRRGSKDTEEKSIEVNTEEPKLVTDSPSKLLRKSDSTAKNNHSEGKETNEDAALER